MILYVLTSFGVAANKVNTSNSIDKTANHMRGKTRKNTTVKITRKVTTPTSVIKNFAKGFLTSLLFIVILMVIWISASGC